MTDDTRHPTLPENVETRAFREFRVDRQEGEAAVTIEGHAATFGEPYQVADFEEQVAPGAFAESIESDDIRALLNHNPDIVLGRNRSGTLRLEEDDVGLRSEIDLPESRVEVLEAIERGDIDQMSFGFQVEEETWEAREEGPDLRTIQQARLFDVSPVAFPANPRTDVAVQRHAEFRSSLEGEGATTSGPSTDEIKVTVDLRPKLRDLMPVPVAMAVLADWHERALSVPRTAEELVFDGTTEEEWSAPDFEDFTEAFEFEGESVEDLTSGQRETIARHSLIGEADAETFDELVSFPVVEPGGPLNRNALVNAKARARFAPDPDALRDRVDELLETYYDVESDEEENTGVPGRVRAKLKLAEAESVA